MINSIPFSPASTKAAPQDSPLKNGRKAGSTALKEAVANQTETITPPYHAALPTSTAPEDKAVDLFRQAQDYFADLQKRHPNFSFSFVDLTNKNDMQNYALSLGKGFHAILSKTFLEKMTANAKAFAEGKSLIESALKKCIEKNKDASAASLGQGLIVQPNGDTAFWTLRNPLATPDQTRGESSKNAMTMPNLLSSKEKHSSTAAFTFRKRLNYHPGSDLKRLASLKTTGQTSSFIMGVQMNMSKVKLDSYLEEAEIKRTIAQMKQVIQRAQTKIRNLQREESIAAQSRDSAKNQEIERAIALAKELKRRQQSRKTREYAQAQDPLHPLPGTIFEKKDNKSFFAAESRAAEMPPPVIPIAPVVTATPVSEVAAAPVVDITV